MVIQTLNISIFGEALALNQLLMFSSLQNLGKSSVSELTESEIATLIIACMDVASKVRKP